MTPERAENDQFGAFVGRVIRAYGRRIAAGDIDALGDLADLSTLVGDTMTEAVAQLRDEWGYSWAEIGRALGVTRQAAHERFGKGKKNPGNPLDGASRVRHHDGTDATERIAP